MLFGVLPLRGESHRFSYALRHVDAKNMIPLAPSYLGHFQIFDKIDSFPKNNFFSLLLWITAENRTKLKRLFI